MLKFYHDLLIQESKFGSQLRTYELKNHVKNMGKT